PAGKVDVHSELMKVATAAVKATREQPSAPSDQGNGKAAPAPGDRANGAAAPTGQVTQAAGLRHGKAGGERKDRAAHADQQPPPMLSAHDQGRWKKLTDGYKTAISERDAAFKERDDLRGPAEQYGKITAYMDQFGITADDMVVAYDLIARMKTDPFSA